MSTPPPTLKIACLHGYCQNATLFRLKTSGLRKSLERPIATARNAASNNNNADAKTSPHDQPHQRAPLAQLVYLDAPFVLEERPDAPPLKPGQRLSESDRFVARLRPRRRPAHPDQPSVANRDPHDRSEDRVKRSWWTARDDGKSYGGWCESLRFLRDTFREEKFDGILGFSQGAIAASLVCALREDAITPVPEFKSLRFSIVVSGYTARDTDLQHLYEKPISLPSMHVWGVEDKVVPSKASRLLLESFDEDVMRHCVVHPKGHLVPSDAQSRYAITNFLLAMSDELQASQAADHLRAAL